jgi:hypothetical protein
MSRSRLRVGGVAMIWTTRTIGLLVTMAVVAGGAVWGVHAALTTTVDAGNDYGLDTNGNGAFDWLVVEAHVSLPQAGTWDVSAELTGSGPGPTGSCGYGGPSPMVLKGTPVSSGPSLYPIAYAYERYFFPAGAQTVRMAFVGTDIARGGIDGPYHVQARLSLGGFPYISMRPISDGGTPIVYWNYTTKAYSASQFEAPMRPAYFTGGASDSAVDLNGDGLADFLEIRADVHVTLAGRYNMNGYLSSDNRTDAVRFIASSYRNLNLTATDTSVVLQFRGDLIRQAAVDGPWNFSLTLWYGFPYVRVNPAPLPIGTTEPPQPIYYPETLCGRTSARRAADFDATIELVRYTGVFQERTPDWNGDGLYDSLVIRAEVDVIAAASFDLSGVLAAASGSPVIARTFAQVWLPEGVQWVEFSFPGAQIRAGGIDGPYKATLSITPGVGRIDPTTTYLTKAYRATQFDAGKTVPAQP